MKLSEEKTNELANELAQVALDEIRNLNKRMNLGESERLALLIGKVSAEAIKIAVELISES